MLRSLASALVLAAACSGGGDDMPTTITCPTSNPPTYASFGQPFFTTFCTPCHTSSLTGSAARNNAPDGVDFDTEIEIRANADEINLMAGIGADGEPNTTMPYTPGPVTTPPTTDQRTTLAEFLVCEEQQ